jgi:hypothetical protein
MYSWKNKVKMFMIVVLNKFLMTEPPLSCLLPQYLLLVVSRLNLQPTLFI